MPQDITSNLVYDDSTGGCVIQLGWSPPINLDQEDISHYIVYIDGINVLNKTSEDDENLNLIFYPVCSCDVHSVSISAVNSCGHEGQRSHNIILEAVALDPGTSAFSCNVIMCTCLRLC